MCQEYTLTVNYDLSVKKDSRLVGTKWYLNKFANCLCYDITKEHIFVVQGFCIREALLF